jgi:hypothetical protein
MKLPCRCHRFKCDWCGVEAPGRSDVRHHDGRPIEPAGWAIPRSYDELLCDGCMAAVRVQLESAYDKAKEYRLSVVGSPPISPAGDEK